MNEEATQKQLESDSECLELAAIIDRLKMTYEQRIEAHENARLLMEELILSGKNLRAKPQTST